MLSAEENALLCRIERDAPMGRMIRRYWDPRGTEVTPLDPFITRITSQKIGYELFNLIDLLPRPKVGALLFASTRDWATKNAAAIAELRAAIAEADDFIRANPDKTRAAINKYTQVPLPILNSLPLPAVDPAIRKDDLDFWAGMMERLHMLQNKPDTAKLIWK